MGKQRFTALDVRASVAELQQLVGLRLLNVYDIPPRMFVFKFGHGDKKRTVLLESGVRFHLTRLVREMPKVPTQFTLKLRKHVRAWRLDSVTQMQHDRTIDMKFGSTDASFHIIVELFAKGNVILTDHEYRIMMLQRTHKDEDVKLFVRELYPVTTAAAPVEGAFEDGLALEEELVRDFIAVLERGAPHEPLKSVLSGLRHFGPSLAEHILTLTGVANTRKSKLSQSGAELAAALMPGLLSAHRITQGVLPPGGYLVAPPAKQASAEASAAPAGDLATVPRVGTVVNDDFSPLLLAQFLTRDEESTEAAALRPAVTVTFRESFGEVVDEFFLTTEVEKIDQHNEKKATAKQSKREKFERDHQRRISQLECESEKNRKLGELIILHAEKVDAAIDLINGALASGIQWDALKGLLKRRHAEGHPVAYMINGLHLERNSISVMLEQEDLFDDEDDNDVPPVVVEVELDKTAYANASRYFTKKKANQSKLEKTIAATSKALIGAELAGTRAAVKQGKVKKEIRRERMRLWWEKFAFFRTSAGDLVLQGRDIATTEILIRRVMRLGDIFVNCDASGSLPCLVRPVVSAGDVAVADGASKGAGEEGLVVSVPVSSVEEAGMWCVTRSPAWEAKQTMSAWWLHASQLTGGTASGCYLYEGEKTYLRPMSLATGVGLLFRVQRKVTVAEEFPCWDTDLLASLRAAGTHPTGPHQEGSSLFLPADSSRSLHTLPPLDHRHGNATKRAQGDGKGATAAKASAPPRQQHVHHDPETVTGAAIAAKEKPLTTQQKRKLQKIKQKYGDQDEEDRLRGALLNGNKLAKVQVAALLKEEMEEPEEWSQDTPVCDPTQAREEPAPDDVGGADGAGNDEVPIARPGAARAPVAGNAAEVDYRTEELLWYTKCPRPDDSIEYVIPVSAPFPVLVDYKYRVELVYGTAKKGQVADAIVGHFAAVASAAPVAELAAVQALDSNEVIEQLRANVKALNTQQVGSATGAGKAKAALAASGGSTNRAKGKP